jgi:hypothetical protein
MIVKTPNVRELVVDVVTKARSVDNGQSNANAIFLQFYNAVGTTLIAFFFGNH